MNKELLKIKQKQYAEQYAEQREKEKAFDNLTRYWDDTVKVYVEQGKRGYFIIVENKGVYNRITQKNVKYYEEKYNCIREELCVILQSKIKELVVVPYDTVIIWK